MTRTNIGIGIGINSSGASNPNGNPSALVATVISDTVIQLDWTIGSTNQDGHKIYISTDNSTFTLKGTVTGSTATYNAESITENTLYYFKVTAYKGSKLSSYSNTSSIITLSTESQALIAAMPTRPDDLRIYDLNQFVNGLITDGLWVKIKAAWIFNAHAEDSALINIKQPGTGDSSKVSTPTFTTEKGFTTADGKYINTNFKPSDDNVIFTKDSASYGIYATDDVDQQNGVDIGCANSTTKMDTISLRVPTNLLVFRVNSVSSSSGYSTSANSLTKGLWVATRKTSSNQKIYKDGLLFGGGNKNSAGLPTVPFIIGGLNTDGVFSAPTINTYGFAFCGANLTSIEVDNLNRRWTKFINSSNILYVRVAIIGDSTTAAIHGTNSVASYLPDNYIIYDISTVGDTIDNQFTKYKLISAAVRDVLNYVVVAIGLNDLNPAESASTALGRYQTLINVINTDSPNAAIIASTMTPCKQRLIDVFGAVDGLTAYQKWLDMNDAIKGNGANAITGVDIRIYNTTTLLNDGNGNLATEYEIDGINDHIHENNVGRQIRANEWSQIIP